MTQNLIRWRQLPLQNRIRWLRLLLPPILIIWVVIYQLGIAQALEAAYGHIVHYGVEIAFYSLAGPVITWVTLVWVERKLREKEALEQQVQAAEREKTAVLAEDRARIARDLHDGVAQTLYFLALKTDNLRRQLADNQTTVEELREMGQTTRQVIREVRRTIFALRPLDWTTAGFWPALHQFIEGFAEQVGWQVTVSIADNLNLPTALEPTVFRLVQESLNNVAKHANAQAIWVEITTESDNQELKLTIRDDGQGFSPENINNHGLGLAQMQARVETAGGIFQVVAQPKGGTAITARLPLTRETS